MSTLQHKRFGRGFQDLRGQHFEQLVVLDDLPVRRGGCTWWRCRCTCGVEKEIRATVLKAGQTSCGCRQGGPTHGMTGTRTHRIWMNMLSRVRNPNIADAKYYHARGIPVCDAWLEFSNFLADMGVCPPKHSLDRTDNDKGYAPDNCVWATPTTQARNQRNKVRYTFRGESLLLSEWEERLGIPLKRLWDRLHISGYSVEEAFTKPARITNYRTPEEQVLRRRATSAIRGAVVSGRLVRPAICQAPGCNGTECIQAHHHKGYAPKFWLDIVWLCKNCHKRAWRTEA